MKSKMSVAGLLFISMLIFLSITASVISHAFATEKSYSWYAVPTKNNSRPTSFEAENIITKHNVIFLGKENKRIYLTFDAGYENGNVEKIVDVLKKQNVKGAFFVLPHFIKANPELIKKMLDDGHLICNHSTTHKDMSKISDFEGFKKELFEIEELYKSQTGCEMSKFFRPPEGRFSESTLEFADKLGYKTVFWSVAYADWDNDKQKNPDEALKLLLSRIHDGAVILLHPTSATNAKIIEPFIEQAKSLGYSFGALDEFE